MDPESSNTSKPQNRRRFISNTFKLAVLGTLISPIEEACNNNRKEVSVKKDPSVVVNKPSTHASHKKQRKKWNYEKLVMNSKTKVMHFPTSKVYTYYDEILPKHLAEISLATWATQLQEPVRLNKEQSGNILEILAMQNLHQGINDDSLNAATDILAKAFTKYCDNSKGINLNMMNFRLHELMLQLITLNKTIPAETKWQVFNSKVKKPDQLRKRQKWMETEENFNARVKYISDHENDYATRLTKRAARYSFS
ncbi:MAG TPA: hypothetical protein VET23_14330 [Chitinophagaceae bacterium]|nr:hypothetical protein [Chitinophagaceae bacterium]